MQLWIIEIFVFLKMTKSQRVISIIGIVVLPEADDNIQEEAEWK